MSPLVTNSSDTIIEITPEALSKLLELRDEEPEKERLGLRIEVLLEPGEEFKYDLSFDVVTQAAFSDEVRTIDGLKIIVPQSSVEHIHGATLDYSDRQGLLMRNPNKPPAPVIDGLVSDDEMSAQIEAVIATDVNPSLAAHGGFVTFVGHDTDGTAYLTMGGGCHGCSMSKMTMLEGVQTTLVEQVPGVVKVRDLTDHTSGSNPFYS
ncbi:MAG: NifU family protein [Ilumatobacteraceae bacterium]|nr:NifU family protein [Ilumatobacteraceae bacterium]